MAYLKVLFQHSPWEREENLRIGSSLIEIQTKYFPNTGLECYNIKNISMGVSALLSSVELKYLIVGFCTFGLAKEWEMGQHIL